MVKVVDGGQRGVELVKVVDGGQWGIELVKVVEMAGSGGVGVGGGCDQGIQLQRWW